MSLKVSKLSFMGYRNLSTGEISLSRGTTLLVGSNATGKTNTIEALQYLTKGSSFRKPTPAELITEGESEACVCARLEGDGRVLDLEMRVIPEKRQFSRNGKPCRGSDLAGILFSILFSPDDLSLVKGSASRRRAELDCFGAQAHKGYKKVFSTYSHSIEQRNHLLKDGCDPSLLDAWDESVALGGATLLLLRLKLFNRLKPLFEEIYREVSSGEQLDCSYIPNVEGVSLDMGRDELAGLIQQQLRQQRGNEQRLGRTLVGPHLDDIHFTIEGRDARRLGSQGQQRSVALAWKMAEVWLCKTLLGEQPLLLLDDVMSELDEARRRCVMDFIQDDIQTVITTTNLGYFTDEMLASAKVINYG